MSGFGSDQLFSRCVEILREEYIMKQDMVREMLEKRSRLLEIHRQQQLDELNLILKSRADLSDTAHALAEKYEDAKETQERFVQRSVPLPILFSRSHSVPPSSNEFLRVLPGFTMSQRL